jgi:hypothetical protein
VISSDQSNSPGVDSVAFDQPMQVIPAEPAALFALNLSTSSLPIKSPTMIAPSTQRWLGSPARVRNRMRTKKSTRHLAFRP